MSYQHRENEVTFLRSQGKEEHNEIMHRFINSCGMYPSNAPLATSFIIVAGRVNATVRYIDDSDKCYWREAIVDFAKNITSVNGAQFTFVWAKENLDFLDSLQSLIDNFSPAQWPPLSFGSASAHQLNQKPEQDMSNKATVTAVLPCGTIIAMVPTAEDSFSITVVNSSNDNRNIHKYVSAMKAFANEVRIPVNTLGGNPYATSNAQMNPYGGMVPTSHNQNVRPYGQAHSGYPQPMSPMSRHESPLFQQPQPDVYPVQPPVIPVQPPVFQPTSHQMSGGPSPVQAQSMNPSVDKLFQDFKEWCGIKQRPTFDDIFQPAGVAEVPEHGSNAVAHQGLDKATEELSNARVPKSVRFNVSADEAARDAELRELAAIPDDIKITSSELEFMAVNVLRVTPKLTLTITGGGSTVTARGDGSNVVYYKDGEAERTYLGTSGLIDEMTKLLSNQ